MVSFLFVDFSSPGYLKILLWRLITSPLLQAFADLLRPSKQLQQSQHFGNIAAILTIKRLVTAAESTSHNGRFAGTRDAQERLRLSSAPSQVCAHTPALCFPANQAGVPDEDPWSAAAGEKPPAGTQGRLAEEAGPDPSTE